MRLLLHDADLIVFDDLNTFEIKTVYKKGIKVAENKTALFETQGIDTSNVTKTVKLDKITSDKFKLFLNSDIVNVIRIIPNSIVTESVTRRVYLDQDNNFKSNKLLDVVKIAVVERHKNTKYWNWFSRKLSSSKRCYCNYYFLMIHII